MEKDKFLNLSKIISSGFVEIPLRWDGKNLFYK